MTASMQDIVHFMARHAAESAQYCLKGNFGTAVDRDGTFRALARGLDALDNEMSERIKKFGQFQLMAGAYAGGFGEKSTEFENLVDQGVKCIEIETKNMRHDWQNFDEIFGKMEAELKRLDPSFNLTK